MFFAIIIVWLLCAYVDVSDARERCLYVCCVAEWMWRCIGLGSSRVATESIQLNINIPFDIFFLFFIECIRCSRCNCPMSIRTGECIHGVVLMGHRQWPKHRGRRHFNIGHASRFDGYVRWSASLKEEDFFFNFHTSITESFFAWIIQLNWNSLHRSAVHRAPDTPLISNAQYIRGFLQITHYSESDQQQICCGTRPSRAPRMDATQVTRSRWRHDAATTTTKKGTQPVESNSVERLWLNQFPVDAGAPLYRLANDDRVALVAQLFSSPTDHHHLCMQPIIATNGLKECEHGERWSIVTNNYHLHYNRSGRGCSLFLYFFSLNSSVFYLHSMALCERIIATRVVRALSSIRIAFGIDAYIVCMR